MPSYLHLTPEALTMRFRTKQQVKNSDLCSLVDDNLPDDLFVLKGNELDIVEPEGTLNKDFALALGFNQITDANKAKQVAKLLVINGPGLDPYTISYYTRRLKNGPYGQIVTNHIQSNFIAAADGGNDYVPFQNSLGNRSDVDNDFVSTLKEKLGALDCFLTPANYLNFQGMYGALANKQGSWNYVTAPAWDTNNKQTQGQEGYETAKKMPPIFQAVTGALNFATLGTYKKALKLFYTKEQLDKQKQEFESGSERKETNGDQLSSDISTAKVVQEAATNILTSISQFLGDSIRLLEFKNANPYQYVNDPINPGNNAQRAQPPGSVGPPPSVTNTPLNNSLGYADVIVKDQNLSNRLFDFAVVTNIPPSISTGAPYTPTYNTYENFTAGGADYVSVFVSKNLGLNVGSKVYSEKFIVNDRVVPMVVGGYIEDSNDTTRVQILAGDPNLALNVQRSALLTIDDQGNKQVCVAPTPTSSFSPQGGYIPRDVRIDTDGVSPPPFYDPDYQPNTSYLDGVLNANTDNFVVVPIGSNIPLGTRVKLTNTLTGKVINAFVGDRGPTQNGLGEMSLNAARELGVWPLPGAKNKNSARQDQPIRWEFEFGAPKVTRKDIR